MPRVFNFSPGPAALPTEVLRRASEEMLDWGGCGMSVMEMSHRSKEFISIAERAEADLRELLGVPPNYKVLFLQGGATSQFAMVPMNLLQNNKAADYLDTGQWSTKAIKEAGRYCQVNVVASAKATTYTTVPDRSQWTLDPQAAYFHYTPNETIAGVEVHDIPEVGDLPLAADMSSTLLSRPLDVSRFALIYAGAQKNLGPAGLTLVLVREDVLGETLAGTPSMFDYRKHADAHSMLNTPPTYAWYLAGLVFQWLKDLGGLEEIGTRNQRKAAKLYAVVDASDFYTNPVVPEYRSRMNIPFTLANAELDRTFLEEAKHAGLSNLKGHRSVGGMRASLYNAMPEQGVEALVEFMADFERRRG